VASHRYGGYGRMTRRAKPVKGTKKGEGGWYEHLHGTRRSALLPPRRQLPPRRLPPQEGCCPQEEVRSRLSPSVLHRG
jgi:hypothetical protein